MARPDDTATAASQISIAGGLPHFGSVIARTNIDLAIEPGTIQRKRRLSYSREQKD